MILDQVEQHSRVVTCDVHVEGVDEMSWDDISKNEMEWPPLKEVRILRIGRSVSQI